MASGKNISNMKPAHFRCETVDVNDLKHQYSRQDSCFRESAVHDFLAESNFQTPVNFSTRPEMGSSFKISGTNIEKPSNGTKKSKWGIVRAMKNFMSLRVELYSPKTITKSMIDEQFDQKNMKRDMSQYTKNGSSDSRNNNPERLNQEFDRAVTDLRVSERFIYHASIGGRKNIDRMTK